MKGMQGEQGKAWGLELRDEGGERGTGESTGFRIKDFKWIRALLISS
jgi:hypothetical protein